MHARAPPEQARRENFGIVQDQAVARAKKLREIAENPVFPALFPEPQHQQARRGAVRKRLLRDRFRRQAIIELRQVQTFDYR